ncbi:MAG: hypothetical protein ACI8Z1_003503, partial [Candidatus Azotimanducaceae bacterium]
KYEGAQEIRATRPHVAEMLAAKGLLVDLD